MTLCPACLPLNHTVSPYCEKCQQIELPCSRVFDIALQVYKKNRVAFDKTSSENKKKVVDWLIDYDSKRMERKNINQYVFERVGSTRLHVFKVNRNNTITKVAQYISYRNNPCWVTANKLRYKPIMNNGVLLRRAGTKHKRLHEMNVVQEAYGDELIEDFWRFMSWKKFLTYHKAANDGNEIIGSYKKRV